MYKVFIDNKPVIFTQNFLKLSVFGLFRTVPETEAMEKGIYLLRAEIPDYLTVVIRSDHPLETMKRFFADHEYVEAAGGIVKRKKRFLLIFRLGVWDLPKGKIDAGEVPGHAALREIEEECGISDLKLKRHITDTWHTYRFKEKLFLKKTYWYSVGYSGTSKTVPQVEENITAVRWMKKSGVRKALKNTYPSIRDVFCAYGKISRI